VKRGEELGDEGRWGFGENYDLESPYRNLQFDKFAYREGLGQMRNFNCIFLIYRHHSHIL
jgi:hypothetical protein